MSGAAPAVLPDAGWLAERPLGDVLAALNGAGIETRVVGGAVRNVLMGLRPGDIDLATTAPPEQAGERATDAGFRVVPTGIAHGTVTVVAAGVPFEVTTLRHDVETHGRHATVAFGADWEADARRRDFTINALYADAQGRLHDPLGGYSDILARRVRFIGDARERIREDYLRILRFFRFHAQYGRGDPDAAGLSAVVAERAGLDGLSAERVREELLRLLAAPGAAGSLTAMAEAGLLDRVLAGVARIADFEALVDQRDGPADAILGLAALAVWVWEDATRLAARLRLSNAERDRLAALEGWWRLHAGLSAEAVRRCVYRAGRAAFTDRLRLARARSRRPCDAGWVDVLRIAQGWEVPVFPLTGRDILSMGVPAGRRVGAILRRIEREWIEGGFAQDRGALLARARAAAAGGGRVSPLRGPACPGDG